MHGSVCLDTVSYKPSNMKPISLLTSLAGAGLLTATLVHAEIDLSSPFQGVSFQRIKAVRDRSSDETSTHRQVLKPFHGRITGHNAASAIAAAEKGQPGAGYQNITALSPYGTQYAMEVIWDGTPIQMIFDTGSSDTWAARVVQFRQPGNRQLQVWRDPRYTLHPGLRLR
ncbi:hypothetical protein HYQ46_008138 [Verticillium longisporum]|nr:hypothetical protein HYQ46_008138 [Verticillium longisporum]